MKRLWLLLLLVGCGAEDGPITPTEASFSVSAEAVEVGLFHLQETWNRQHNDWSNETDACADWADDWTRTFLRHDPKTMEITNVSKTPYLVFDQRSYATWASLNDTQTQAALDDQRANGLEFYFRTWGDDYPASEGVALLPGDTTTVRVAIDAVCTGNGDVPTGATIKSRLRLVACEDPPEEAHELVECVLDDYGERVPFTVKITVEQ